MEKTLLDRALALGLTTQEELRYFEIGYYAGQTDTYAEVSKDIDKANNRPQTYSIKEDAAPIGSNPFMEGT